MLSLYEFTFASYVFCSNLADVKIEGNEEALTKSDHDLSLSTNSSLDSALESSADQGTLDLSAKNINNAACDNSTLLSANSINASKSIDSEDSAFITSGHLDSSNCDAAADCLKNDNSNCAKIDARQTTTTSGNDVVSKSSSRPTLQGVASLRTQSSEDTLSMDESMVSSTQVTTGADTPSAAATSASNLTLRDGLGDLRSSNSSLTSVTSRASFMSPLNTDQGDGEIPLRGWGSLCSYHRSWLGAHGINYLSLIVYHAK